MAAAAAIAVALACGAGPGVSLPAEPPAAVPPPAAGLPTPTLDRRTHPPFATEAGFTHCCGSADYKLEIDCGDMRMRCYRRGGDGGWHYTYGRLCRRHLGDGCYPAGCDDVCVVRGSR